MKSHLAKLELEVALLVKDLNAVVVGVRHHNLIVRGQILPLKPKKLRNSE